MQVQQSTLLVGLLRMVPLLCRVSALEDCTPGLRSAERILQDIFFVDVHDFDLQVTPIFLRNAHRAYPQYVPSSLDMLCDKCEPEFIGEIRFALN
jgi:hypothetical protein